VYTCKNMSVRKAIELYRAGQLNTIDAPNNT
jgi:hypothetical protein